MTIHNFVSIDIFVYGENNRLGNTLNFVVIIVIWNLYSTEINDQGLLITSNKSFS